MKHFRPKTNHVKSDLKVSYERRSFFRVLDVFGPFARFREDFEPLESPQCCRVKLPRLVEGASRWVESLPELKRKVRGLVL